MRIKIDLKFDTLVLPLDYQHALQAFIYKNMSTEYAEMYHSQSTGTIKPFVFSRLFGDYTIKAERMVFLNKAHFYLASCDEMLILDICKNLSVNESYDIFSNYITIDTVHILKNTASCDGTITYRTISPVILYCNNAENRREYLVPNNPKYIELLASNIYKKVSHLSSDCYDIEIVDINNFKKGVYKYKKYMYTGYDYSITIKTNKYVHNIIQDSGIGYRNAIGFGMLESISKYK